MSDRRPPVDDELDDLFRRPSDVAFAQRLHDLPHPAVDADPAFREALRRRLMQEAWKQKEPRRPWYRRLLGPPGLAWAGAMAGVLLIVFATVTLSQNTNSTQQVFSSPINGHTQVATTSAIVVNFPQPMEPASTQSAAKITPATEASFQWSNNNRTLTITPKNDGLAPGVQYQVTFTAAARTESNQPLTTSAAAPSPITFVTQQSPPPTPAPTPPVTSPSAPAPTPPVSPLSGVRLLGSSNGSQPVWALDGTQVYVIGAGGSVTSYPARGGAGSTFAAKGVTQVVAGPAGPAFLAGTSVTYAGVTTQVPGVTSIGFESTTRGAELIAVTGTKLTAVTGGAAGPTLAAAPTAPAKFSPNGSEMVYLAANGLHLVNLGTADDQAVGTATGLGDWAPDGTHFAYINHGSLAILNTATGSTTGITGMTGVTAVSWTNNGLLVSSGAGIQELLSPDATPSPLTGPSDTAATWSPASVLFGYVKGGQAYVASVDTSSSMAAVSNVVTQFMAARQSGNETEAESLLTPAAEATIGTSGGLDLTTDGSLRLNRWSLILAQPSGVAVVRTVFSQGTQEEVFDEQLKIARSGRQFLIQQGTATPIQAGAPAIQSITVGGSSLAVKFDSDVNPATVSAGVAVQSASGAVLVPQSASYSAVTRTVIISLPTLAAGQQYQLQIAPALKDVNGLSATHVQIAFTSPTTPPATLPSPAPTPSPSASPATSPTPSTAPSSTPSPTPTH